MHYSGGTSVDSIVNKVDTIVNHADEFISTGLEMNKDRKCRVSGSSPFTSSN
ncbi:MAG: hypothetical protein IJ784_13930 [Ruminiclostridium sp.]|nr:hypothetical protein [Ruminiclostridium sp.]